MVSHLDDQPWHGDASEDTELCDSNPAMMREFGSCKVPNPPPKQTPHSCCPKEQGHKHAGVKIRHAHQLHVEGQEHKSIPGYCTHNPLHHNQSSIGSATRICIYILCGKQFCLPTTKLDRNTWRTHSKNKDWIHCITPHEETKDSVQNFLRRHWLNDIWTTSRMYGKGGIISRPIACIGQEHHGIEWQGLQWQIMVACGFCHNRVVHGKSPAQW